MNHRFLLFFAATTVFPALACSSSSDGGGTGGSTSTGSATGPGPSSSSGATSGPTSSSSTGGSSSSSSSGAGGGGGAGSVVFSYTPAWKGVSAVTVIGAFGQASDWDPKQPFATLTDDGKGNWTATASLSPGKYLYVYQVTGDMDGTKKTARYTIDPAVSAFAACPAESPTYNMNEPNPCSELDVPQGAPATLQHITGVVNYGGSPIGGYLVEVERDEAMSHHFFANRTDSAADGTFDLAVAPGAYRIQVLHPTFYQKTDADRDPAMLAALRRAISTSFDVTADVALDAPEMKFSLYGDFSPQGTGTLPATLTFAISAGAENARASVYGTKNGMGNNVGDPWFSTMYGAATTADFDGTFNTKQALEMAVVPGEQYWWGTWEQRSAGGKVMWSGQSMVLPIKF